MIQFILTLGKRFAVLLPGIVITFFAVREIFPYFDQRLPLALAVFITYVIVAYVAIPASVRLWRVIRPSEHQPLYSVTPDGYASDPLNIGIIGTRGQLIDAMERAGWYVADPHKLKFLLRQVASTILGWSYPNAPVSNLYLFGRKQDVAFEIPVESSAARRHHVRFWATTYDAKKPLGLKTIHWYNRRSHIGEDNLLWVGAASLDVGINFIRHNFQLTHMIDPDTNQERELIVDQLQSKNLVKNTKTIKLGEPYRLINRVFSGTLHTDGKMTVVTLKPRKP